MAGLSVSGNLSNRLSSSSFRPSLIHSFHGSLKCLKPSLTSLIGLLPPHFTRTFAVITGPGSEMAVTATHVSTPP